MAKIASDLEKPDGLVVVPPGEERDFLAPLAVGKLWGIGPKTVERLHQDGIATIGDLATQSDDWFARRFGKRAAGIHAKALGQDDDPVKTERSPKSISAETTFADDLSDWQNCVKLWIGCRPAWPEVWKGKASGQDSYDKAEARRFHYPHQANYSAPYTNAVDDIQQTGWTLLSAELAPGRAFRLLGVGMSGFESEVERPWQLPLPWDVEE